MRGNLLPWPVGSQNLLNSYTLVIILEVYSDCVGGKPDLRGQRWLSEEPLATHQWIMIPSLKSSGLGYDLVVQGIVVSFLVQAGDSSLPKHPDWLWGPTSLYLVSTSDSFSVSKVAGMGKQSLLYNTKV